MSSMRVSAGRPPRKKPEVSETVMFLIDVVKTKPPHVVEAWLRQHDNVVLDSELELLATHVLSLDVDTGELNEVKSLLSRGLSEAAMQALISRMRRRFAKILRDHQRAEDDAFTEACIIE